MTTILHPVYTSRDGAGFAVDLGQFLPAARRSPTNYALVIGLVVGPVLALVGLRDDPTGAPFVLTALGLVLTVTGPLLVSMLLAEPTRWPPTTTSPGAARGSTASPRSPRSPGAPPG